MDLVRESGDFRWYESQQIRLRMQAVDDGHAWRAWVAIDRRSVGLVMAMYDFVDWCTDELVVAVEPDSSWQGIVGFTIHLDDSRTIAHQVQRFLSEWTIAASDKDPLVSDAMWYATTTSV